MKLKLTLLLTSLFYFACSNKPLKSYQFDRIAFEANQKVYEKDTIQQESIQSKSLLTITKNEITILATIEIIQNWTLDTLKQEFEPVPHEAQVKQTYFQDDIHIKPNIFEVKYYEYDEPGKYHQPFDIAASYGISRGSITYYPKINSLPVLTNLNGLELGTEKSGRGFSNSHELTFDSKIMESGIIKLAPSSHISTKYYEDDVFKIDVHQRVITNLNTIERLTTGD